ncbi:MAG TPA: urease accessory protein UreF [Beijerinckiaceae bacterium]
MATSTIEPALALFAWLSPSYPVGAYAYSHGLEWAVERGEVRDGETLHAWLAALLEHGSARNDAVLFALSHACAREGGDLAALAELAVALAASRERRLETLQQGAGFLAATRAAWPHPALEAHAARIGADTAYPVCFAAAVAAHGLPLRPALDGFLNAFAGNLVSACVRMSVVGQTEGQATLARLSPLAAAVASAADGASLDDLGGCAFRADLAALHHETQHARLFRS